MESNQEICDIKSHHKYVNTKYVNPSRLTEDFPRNDEKYLSILNQTVIDVLRRRRISVTIFSEMFHNALIPSEDSFTKRRAYINLAIRMITGLINMSYNQFKFIMEKVLHEDIPDDPEIEHIKNLRSRGRDLRGQKFNRLTVIECVPQSDTDHGKLYWKCKCDCGNETVVRGTHITDNTTVSCGCYNRERSIKQLTTHGKSKTKTYKSWDCMKQRCYNPNDKHYPDYGGRGIIICDRWRNSFQNFYDDMGDRPKHKTIDRIDVNGIYEPSNCRWATIKEQNNNMRHTLSFEDGESVNLWADDHGYRPKIVRRLYRKGMNKEQIVNSLCCEDISND